MSARLFVNKMVCALLALGLVCLYGLPATAIAQGTDGAALTIYAQELDSEGQEVGDPQEIKSLSDADIDALVKTDRVNYQLEVRKQHTVYSSERYVTLASLMEGLAYWKAGSTLTVATADEFSTELTYEQAQAPQYFFPNYCLLDPSSEDAVPVEPAIIYQWTSAKGGSIASDLALEAAERTPVDGCRFIRGNADTSSLLQGNSSPSDPVALTIGYTPVLISSASVSVQDQVYTGAALEPEVVLQLGSQTLTQGSDFTVVYANNVNVGKGQVSITGCGVYKGTLSATFAIIAQQDASRGQGSASGASENGNASSSAGSNSVTGATSGTSASAGNGAVAGTDTASGAGATTGNGSDGNGSLANGSGAGAGSGSQSGAAAAGGSGTSTDRSAYSATPGSTKASTAPSAKPAALAKGKTVAKGAAKYTVTGKSTVAYKAATKKAATSAKVPATVKLSDGRTYRVTAVKAKAFKGMAKLAKVTIGSNVATIEAKAFCKLPKLAKVAIGKGVKKIAKGAFCKTPKLKAITVKSAKLSKKGSVKGALKGSKAKALTVKAPKAKKAAYKKSFTKKNLSAPRAVKVK